MTGAWKVLPLCLWLCSLLKGGQAISLRHDAHRELGEKQRKPSVQVQGLEILGRDWSGTDYGEVVTFFDVPYTPGSCPNCTQPRFSYSDSSRWSEGLSSPIRADGPNPRKFCAQLSAILDITQPPDAEMTEDCLYLDIYAPREAILGKKKKPKRSVLVFIHGGQLVSGDKSAVSFFGYAEQGYEGLPEDERPIAISINYRLDAYGGIRHPELEPKQWLLWLLDCVEALKWINKHIGKFGGDKSKVTIMGQSAGANIVGYLTRTPLAQGLIHGAIPISGFALADHSILPTDEAASVGPDGLGLAEWWDNALAGESIFNVSIDTLVSLTNAEPDYYPSLTKKGDQVVKLPVIFDPEVIPPYTGWDNGRDDDKDVPLFILGDETELYAGPLANTAYMNPYSLDKARAFVDDDFKTQPLYANCLRKKLEEIQLEAGQDPTFALFSSYQTAAQKGIGMFFRYFPTRPNVFTGAFTNQAYNMCEHDLDNPFAFVTPCHGSELFGNVADLTPWLAVMNKTTEELLAMKNKTRWGNPIFCQPIKSQKHALEVGTINPAVHHEIRKAIVNFVVHGTPGWRNDQHVNFQPDSTGTNGKQLMPALDEQVRLTQAFLTKCVSECRLLSDQDPALRPPTKDVCKDIIDNIKCVC